MRRKKQSGIVYRSQSYKKRKIITLIKQIILCTVIVESLLFVALRGDLFSKPVAQEVLSATSENASSSSYLVDPLLTPTASHSSVPTLPVTFVLATEATPASVLEPEEKKDYCVDVPVLLYHHIQPLSMAELLGHPQLTVDSTIFDEQMQYLVTHGYTILSAEDLVLALLNSQPLPAKPVVITIDDGYDDNYTYAFLTAKKYNIVMNFMIPTDLIDKPGYMTWDHLHDMAKSPVAKIYNHTATHAPLGYITDEEIEAELTSSSKALKEKLGLKNTIFTYPYGAFSDAAIQKVIAHGFWGAYSTIEGRQQCASQIMTLQRLHIGNAPLDFYGF